MPLDPGKSRAAFERNVRTEVAAGKKPKQAVAIAFHEQGEGKKSVEAAAEHHLHHRGHPGSRHG